MKKIRCLYVHEKKSQREIARLLGVSRTTVRKCCDGSVFPNTRKEGSGRKSHIITNELITFIEECLLEDDQEQLKKQRHTAKGIHSRLVEQLNFTGSESAVRRVVAQMKNTVSKAFISLNYEPAEVAQIDWGEAKIYLNGE